MKTTPSNITRKLNCWGLALALTTALPGMALAQTTGTVEVKLGEAVPRTYDDVKAAGYAYGPKQEADATTKETHVWLPYGTKGIYSETVGTKVVDPEPGNAAMMVNGVDGFTCVQWGYKLHFDKPISGLRMSASWAELGLKNAVAGVEYSVDGQKWTTLYQTEKGGIVNEFLDPATVKATGLKTQDLTIRFYSRSKTDPASPTAEGAWFKIRT
ncbi:MAG: hypothetical protein WC003_14965, partial [Terrimicrobiaceae bacterium]